MAVSVWTGRYAHVEGVNCVQGFTVTADVSADRYTAACVDDGTAVPRGVTDYRIEIRGFGDEPGPLFPKGVLFPFVGVVSDGGAGNYHSITGNVLIEDLTISLDQTNGSAIGWVATGGFDGGILIDESHPDPPSPSTPFSAANGNRILIGETPLIVIDWQQVEIVFRRPQTTWAYNDVTWRAAGALECDLNITMVEKEFEEYAGPRPFDINQLNLVLVETRGAAATGWVLKDCRFLGKSNYVVDRQTNDVLGFTVNAMWNAVDGTTQGKIQGPSGDDYWLPNFDPAP